VVHQRKREDLTGRNSQSRQRNLLPQVCLPTKIQVLKAHQAILPRRKNLKTRGKMQKVKKKVAEKMRWIEKAAKTQRLLHLRRTNQIQNCYPKEKKKRVDLIREDSEGAPTADVPTSDVWKTGETLIGENEGMLRKVLEVIEDEMIVFGKTAGVTRVADETEDPTVDEIRDQLENPKTSRKTEKPCRKQPILTKV